jgi:hypothetical protein
MDGLKRKCKITGTTTNQRNKLDVLLKCWSIYNVYWMNKYLIKAELYLTINFMIFTTNYKISSNSTLLHFKLCFKLLFKLNFATFQTLLQLRFTKSWWNQVRSVPEKKKIKRTLSKTSKDLFHPNSSPGAFLKKKKTKRNISNVPKAFWFISRKTWKLTLLFSKNPKMSFRRAISLANFNLLL